MTLVTLGLKELMVTNDITTNNNNLYWFTQYLHYINFHPHIEKKTYSKEREGDTNVKKEKEKNILQTAPAVLKQKLQQE